jgi:hypothetical protein
VEQANAGADTAYSSLADYTLAPNVENLVLLPVATNGSGNELDNVLVGQPLGQRARRRTTARTRSMGTGVRTR